jgi:hypothetical protein
MRWAASLALGRKSRGADRLAHLEGWKTALGRVRLEGCRALLDSLGQDERQDDGQGAPKRWIKSGVAPRPDLADEDKTPHVDASAGSSEAGAPFAGEKALAGENSSECPLGSGDAGASSSAWRTHRGIAALLTNGDAATPRLLGEPTLGLLAQLSNIERLINTTPLSSSKSALSRNTSIQMCNS